MKKIIVNILVSALAAVGVCFLVVPGIADLAGNCMEKVEYHFTVPEPEPTPYPICTPVACDVGSELVCMLEGGCPDG